MHSILFRSAGSIGALGLALTTGTAAFAAPASAAGAATPADAHLVFAQTNDPGGNAIVTFDRTKTGQLVRLATTGTGGRGGTLGGAESDKLGSQGSLVYDRAHRMLLAVNAGSNSVTAFTLAGHRLTARQTLGSGGTFPVSIAVRRNLVYVVSALRGGSVTGFRIVDGRLRRMPHSTRPLGLDPAATPQFLNTPGQVGFTPDGRHLLVTTKVNGSRVEAFAVGAHGRLAGAPVDTTLPGQVPFAFLFDPAGRLLLTEAGPGTLASFRLGADGHLIQTGQRPGDQVAPCWIVAAGGHYYVTNTGSGTISGYRVTDGAPAFLVPGGIVAATAPGPIDLATSGRYLYAMTGIVSTLEEFRVRRTGELVPIGSLPGIGADAEGIAATDSVQ